MALSIGGDTSTERNCVMSEQTLIPWCDSTWNPWRGCDKVSEGCEHCYITRSAPFRASGQKHGDPRVLAKSGTFNAPMQWNKKPWVCDVCGEASETDEGFCERCGCRRKLHRRRVFSLSLGDWLDPQVPVEWLAQMLDMIRRCPDLDFLLCTKRPELWWERTGLTCDLIKGRPMISDLTYHWVMDWRVRGKAPKNVWILVSAENQKRADERIPHLLRIPAVVRGLSCEPLLGPLGLARWFDAEYADGFPAPPLHWVIVGGESGRNARPCNVGWVRDIKDQCKTARVPVFVKQLGAKPTWGELPRPKPKHPKGGDPAEWPEDLRVREFPELR